MTNSYKLHKIANQSTSEMIFRHLHFNHAWFVCLISATSEDYKLLEKMNKATISKYVEMKHIASNIGKAMTNLHEKC